VFELVRRSTPRYFAPLLGGRLSVAPTVEPLSLSPYADVLYMFEKLTRLSEEAVLGGCPTRERALDLVPALMVCG
jgi:hypothetical protein